MREWHEPDGLPSEEIDRILLDERGYLWIAAAGKLARFDGTAFEPTKSHSEVLLRAMVWRPAAGPGRPGGLIAPVNLSAAVSSGGDASAGDGYFLSERNTFRFLREPALAGKTVRSLFAHNDGTLWFACDDGTLLRDTGGQLQLFSLSTELDARRAPYFAVDKSQTLWVAIGTRVWRFDDGAWFPIGVPPQELPVRLVSSRSGGPWLLTQTAAFRWTGSVWERIVDLPELLGSHYIQSAIEDQHGHLWIGTRSQGLHRVIGRQTTRIPISHDDVEALCEDLEGNIWVGTNGGGLTRLKVKAFWLYDRSTGLTESFSHAVAEDSQGTIWLANRDGGVAIIKDGKVDPLSKRANLGPLISTSVFPAAEGGVWIATTVGIFRSEAENPDQLTRIEALSTFRNARVTLVARNGDFWFSQDLDRIVRWRAPHATVFGPAEGFDGREIRAISEDPGGAIWLGTVDGKLFRSIGERFEEIRLQNPEQYGGFQEIQFEPDGTILVGTTRKGLLIFPRGDLKNPKLLSLEQGIPNENVTNLLADDGGRYWFASRGGIFSLRRAQLFHYIEGRAAHVHSILMGKDDGLPVLPGLGRSQPSAWKSRDGTLWFATRRGVVRIDPALTSDDAEISPVTIAEIRCDTVVEQVSTRLELPANSRRIEIRMSVLSLSAPERILVRHRLDGFDDEWVVLGRNRTAVYPRLPPGRYVLRAEASNGTGVWKQQQPLLEIVVVPLWWQTWWAQVLYLLGLVTTVTVLARTWSHRRLRLRLERLERQQAIERERTRIAQNIHDDVGASLTRISLLTQAAHQDSSPSASLEKIYETVRSTTRSLDEIVWAVNPKCDEVENLVYYISNYAQSFLATANIRCRLDLPETLPTISLTSQVRHNLFLCCKEALNNVVKHAAADEVVITIAVTEATLQITVADNGRGIAAAREGSSNPFRSISGNGLENMKRRMVELGGTCAFSSGPNGGTEVSFSVPLAPPSK